MSSPRKKRVTVAMPTSYRHPSAQKLLKLLTCAIDEGRSFKLHLEGSPGGAMTMEIGERPRVR